MLNSLLKQASNNSYVQLLIDLIVEKTLPEPGMFQRF